MKRILDKRNMSAQDWEDYRAKQTAQPVIGGSEVASILGIENQNYGKPKFTLWLEKTGQKEPAKLDNEFIKWGNIMEPVIRKEFAKETGFKVYQNNFVLQHDHHKFMIANIDGEVIDPSRKGRGILEIKTTSEWNLKEWQEDKVPIQYQAQVLHYLAVTGYEYAYIVVLIGGNKLRHWLIERNEEQIEMIIEAEKEFLEAVKNQEFPWSIGGSAEATNWLHSEYPNAIDEVESMPQEIEDLAIEYTELSEEKKLIDKRMAEIKNQVKLQAKDIKTLKGQKVKIYLPTVNKVLFDQKRFGEEQPELLAEYKTKISSYRDFKIKALEA